jgi:hypothetical protein
MELEFLVHTLWWLFKGLSQGDPFAWSGAAGMPSMLAIAVDRDLRENRRKKHPSGNQAGAKR